MAKAKRRAGKRKRLGKVRKVPAVVHAPVVRALAAIRFAKVNLERKAPNARKAWAELHNSESRLSRLV